jgi:hypothetical protein
VVQDALLPDGQAPVEAGVRLERLETCLPDASYDGLRLPEPPAVRAETSGLPVRHVCCSEKVVTDSVWLAVTPVDCSLCMHGRCGLYSLCAWQA